MDAQKPFSTQFEQEVRAAMAVQDPDAEFLASLKVQILAKEPSSPSTTRHQPFARPARMRTFGALSLIGLILLAVGIVVMSLPGPANAMRRLFGYIPGVGIIDQGAPIRVLAEPVSATREGITVSVNRATLTIDRTQVDYGVSGVPLSAHPKSEAITGCIERPYLRLQDGTHVELDAPLPGNVSEAVFVMPCILNTLSGTTPVNWELPLKFVPAPPDLTVMPVIEPTQTMPPIDTQPAALTTAEATGTPVKPQPVALTIDQVIQTADGYILMGAIRLQDKSITGLQQKGVLVLRDAAGKKVSYTHAEDVYGQLDWSDENVKPFAIQFQAGGVSFPLTLRIPGAVVTEPDPQAAAEFEFDAGENPQPGQEWPLNQDIQLAGHTLNLAFVRIDSRNDFYFGVNVAEDIDSLSVGIKGLKAGGYGMSSYSQGRIGTSVSFAELPKGKLAFVFSHLRVAGETQFWQIQWQPDGMTANWPTATAAANPVCLDADSISRLPALPAGLDGRVLLTQTNPELRLLIAGLDGSQRQELPLQSSRGAFSPDGQKVAYPSSDGIAILDLATDTTKLLKGQPGYGLSWSPDGSQIAYLTSGDPYGIFVIPAAGDSAPKQLSTLGYELLAGWSPDGKLIYYAIPGASGDGSFLLRSVEASRAVTQDLFTLERSSRKAPLPKVSPDGKWVAYRAGDNGSLYLKAMDGKSPARLRIDNPGLAISGIAWDKQSHLLGVSLVGYDGQNGIILLLQPDGCEAYRLPGLDGELDGVLIP